MRNFAWVAVDGRLLKLSDTSLRLFKHPLSERKFPFPRFFPVS